MKTDCRKNGGNHMGSEETILAKVEAKRGVLIDLLSKLVRIPSLTGEEGEAQGFVEKYLKDLGLKVDAWEPDIKELFDKYPEAAQYPTHWQHDLVLSYKDCPTYSELVKTGKIDILNYRNRPNVVGWLRGAGSGRSLILNGHIDTVPVGPKERWTVDAFGAQIKDNKMFGRGTTDMKGGLAAAIGAIQCLIESDVKLKGDVIIESVVNEEHSGNGTLACIAKGIMADAAIIVESSEFDVHISEAGNLYWEVIVKGEPTAPGERWRESKQQGVSAIEKLPEVIRGLVDLESELNKTPPHFHYKDKFPISLVLGKISGGSYETITAEECSIRGSLYFAPHIGSVGKVMEQVKNAVSRASEKDPWLKSNPPEVRFLGSYLLQI